MLHQFPIPIFLLVAVPLAAQIHVNACTPQDAGFTGGTCYTSPMALPPGAALYLQQERYGNFNYRFPVADGQYTVTLHFIENSTAITGPSQRGFAVNINGVPVVTLLDLAAAAPLNTPVDRTFPVTTSGGNGIAVTFTTVLRNAVVSAIDITPVPVPPFPGCSSDGAGGIACTGSIVAGGFVASGDGHVYDPAITWGGITYRLPKDDGTGKHLQDSGVAPCGNLDPAFLATSPVCHQFVWALP